MRFARRHGRPLMSALGHVDSGNEVEEFDLNGWKTKYEAVPRALRRNRQKWSKI